MQSGGKPHRNRSFLQTPHNCFRSTTDGVWNKNKGKANAQACLVLRDIQSCDSTQVALRSGDRIGHSGGVKPLSRIPPFLRGRER